MFWPLSEKRQNAANVALARVTRAVTAGVFKTENHGRSFHVYAHCRAMLARAFVRLLARECCFCAGIASSFGLQWRDEGARLQRGPRRPGRGLEASKPRRSYGPTWHGDDEPA